MTTNTNDLPNNADSLRALIDNITTLADLPDFDAYELIALVKPFMPTDAFVQLATAFDMCPIHLTDLDSCRDDDALDTPETDDMIPLTACRHLR